MKYYVIEHYKGEPCGCDKICDTKAEAEAWITFQFENNPGIDYKTTFTIEERDEKQLDDMREVAEAMDLLNPDGSLKDWGQIMDETVENIQRGQA